MAIAKLTPERVCEGVEFYPGDCRDVHPQLAAGSYHAVVTDPPYGTQVDEDGYGRRQLGPEFIAGDKDLSALDSAARQWPKLLRPKAWVVVFVSPKRRYDAETVLRMAGWRYAGEVVWDKAMMGLGGGIRYQHETVLLGSFDGKAAGLSSLVSVIRASHGFNGNPRWHPHEKPLRLLRDLIAYASPPGGRVLDSFAGSGGLGIAAAAAGRTATLIELDPAHARVLRERLGRAETGGPGSLFHDSGKADD